MFNFQGAFTMLKSRSLCDLLVNDLNLKLNDPVLVDVASDVVLYLTGVNGAYELQHSLKAKVDFSQLEDSAKTFRLKLLETSYLSLKLKYFSFTLALYPFNQANISKFASDFEMDRNDVVLLKRVFSITGFRTRVRKSERILNLNKNNVSYEAYCSMYKLFDEIYPNVLWHIKGITNKKLRFITFSNNLVDSDFHSDLVCKAITTFNKLMPTIRDPLYVQNYVKRAITNHTNNIIKSYTTQKRGRLVKGKKDGYGGNSYDLVVTSENQMSVNKDSDGNISYDSLQNSETKRDSIEYQEHKLNFRSILKYHGTTKRRRDFILIISGIEHNGFTDYLHKHCALPEDKDNNDHYNKVAGRIYFKQTCAYLNLCTKRASRFLNYIGETSFPEKIERCNHAA